MCISPLNMLLQIRGFSMKVSRECCSWSIGSCSGLEKRPFRGAGITSLEPLLPLAFVSRDLYFASPSLLAYCFIWHSSSQEPPEEGCVGGTWAWWGPWQHGCRPGGAVQGREDPLKTPTVAHGQGEESGLCSPTLSSGAAGTSSFISLSHYL